MLYLINKEFAHAASLAFNPRNSLHISKNDGFFDNGYNQQRDVIINTNTFARLGRAAYNTQQIEAIRAAQSVE